MTGEKHPFKLSDFFPPAQIVRDGEFSHLDEGGTGAPDALAYCQTLEFLRIALSNPNVAAILTTEELASEVVTLPCAVDPDPRSNFFRIYTELSHAGHLTPQMESDFGRGEDCQIHPSAVISEESIIGDRVTIGPHAVIQPYSSIGAGTFVDAGVVVGAEGMMTVEVNGRRLRIPHAGGVSIGRDVIVLANAVVVKSLFREFTSIGDESQIGVLANIGHGVQIGRRCLIRGNCVISGRAIVEDGAVVALSSTVVDACRIGENAEVKMGSVVIKPVAAGEAVSGNFAYSHRQHVNRFLKDSKKHQ